MDTIQRIIELLNKKGISGAKMSRDLGFSNAVFSQWKTGKQKPSMTYIEKMAEYFGVSVDYLLGKTDIKKAPSVEDAELKRILEIFPKLPPEVRAQIIGTAEAIVNSNSRNNL